MIGIAIKPSKINEDIVDFGHFIGRYFDYYIIDAENEVIKDEEILERLEKISKVVMTVQAKRVDAFELLELYASYGFDLCVVLGNKQYLTEKERKFKNYRILDVIKEAMRCSRDIWVGIEGVESLVKDIVEEHNLIAYYLYGQECSINSKRAIYVPYATKINENALESMKGYLNRRKNYRGNWRDFILSLNDEESIERIKNNDIVVGYPIIPNKEEILNFVRCFSV
ncbi:TPA: hypothetical protein HA335_05460 [Methanocaldococcus jannaschii]|uniref:Uncharacterized protein MJ1239 n=2 Tax=Methanocaldococcus jannaschii TaxID=2190 RepID=Y1239_METJA|nr:hypothetical protein [Methanocaldococcus jannaschii]Q58636.1 RecName: Full=Uncharacterized protein MJ1239 [Methanocaldococcus jannaschii DSM 2661]AAB99244.1 hypothetical protein MJ_1239 [Methanocaldococcus jannaschii DSM 2661]HII59998.1 hypothetical protein [Methanocaldococcus jannaschii]